MKKTIVLLVVLVLMIPALAIAQTSPDDPEIQKAKEETAVVFDLGRLFGYLQTMEKDQKNLALNNSQLIEIYSIMKDLKTMERVEPKWADERLTQLEDNILTPDQLMYTDQLAIAREAEQETKTPGSGGGGQITSYIAGGAFNPMADPSKTIGKDFASFFDYVSKKLGK